MVAPISHAKKHGLNSDNDHIKDKLEIDGTGITDDTVLSIPNNTRFNFAKGSVYDDHTFMQWVDSKLWLEIGHCVKIDGSLNLQGEASIIGGELSNDSLTFYPNQDRDTPYFTFEGQTSALFFLNTKRSEYYGVLTQEYTPKDLFRINTYSDGTSLTSLVVDIGYTPAGDPSFTTINMNGFVTQLISHEIYAGDNTSNYMYIDSKGNITLYGDARQIRELVHDAYNLYGNAATYNGIDCSAAGTGVINDFFFSMTLNGGSGWGGGPEAFITLFKLPADYEEGSDIDVVIHYTSDQTSGSALIGVGVSPAGTSYNKNDTYQTQTIPAPSAAYDRADYSFTFSGSSLMRGDEVGVVVYRDPDNANDDMDGDAMITAIAIEYTANRIGGSI